MPLFQQKTLKLG